MQVPGPHVYGHHIAQAEEPNNILEVAASTVYLFIYLQTSIIKIPCFSSQYICDIYNFLI